MSGKFTEKQKQIFTGVLNAQIAVYRIMREGVTYHECHLTAEKEIIKQLIRIGIIIGGTAEDEKFIEELSRIRMGANFMPHGLGHFIGCDTHDVGG